MAARAIPRQIRGWDFWEITNPDSSLAWLGLTRERAASAIDRQKVWTLLPRSRLFVANWFVTEDRLRSEDQIWNHQMIDIADARELLVAVPQPTGEVVKRLCRPAAALSLDQLDNHSVLKVMGGRANHATSPSPAGPRSFRKLTACFTVTPPDSVPPRIRC